VTTGNVFVYDIETGKQTARISVPEEGKLAAVSSDGSRAYYLSPKLLSIIDLEGRRISAKIDLPFLHGMLAPGSN